MKPTVITSVLVAGLALAGCSSSGSSSAPTVSPNASATATSPTAPAGPTVSPTGAPSPTRTTPAPVPTLVGASTSPVVRGPSGRGVALLTSVRVAGHPGFDRVVLQFDGPVPGLVVRYVTKPVREDPSNRVVTIRGTAALQVTMRPASGTDLTSPTAARSYTGPGRVRGSTSAVTEVVRSGDFENVLSWVVGVDAKAPFRVLTATNPSRVIIDVSTS